MTWGVVAVAAVSAVGAGVSAASANKAGAAGAKANSTAQYNSAAESYRATELKYMQLQQDYKATDEQNLMTQVRQNYRMGLMNVQKGMMARDATAKGYDTSQQAAAYLGSASANQAASQTIGASADAVMNDIRMKAGEAQATHEQNYSQQLQNFNSEVEALRLNNETQFKSPQEILTSSTSNLSDPIQVNTDYAYTNPWGAAAVGGISSAAGSYLSGKTSLNLGAAPASYSAGSTAAFGPTQSSLGSGTFGMGGSQSSASPINGGWKIY